MSAPISSPLAGPRWTLNKSPEEAQQAIQDAITLWVGNQRLEAAMVTEELAQLSGMQKILALRNGLLINVIRYCRLNPKADSRLAILTMITFLADNSRGLCRLSTVRMAEIFTRDQRSIHASITALEKDDLIGVNRVTGLPNSYWPKIPGALVEMSANSVWFVDALSTKPKARVYKSQDAAIAAATQEKVTPDVHVRGDVERPLTCTAPTPDVDQHSISLSNSPLSKGEHGGSGKFEPHLSTVGFVVSTEHTIPMATIERWRRQFPAIPNLEAQLGKLASVFLKKGIMHPGWSYPEAWMAGCLADDNQRAADAARIANAKVASAQRNQQTKTFRR